MLVKEVGEKGLSPVINFIYTGELELGDLSWAGTDYTDLLNLQLMKFDLKGGMIADNIWGNGEILDNPDFRKGLRKDLNSDLFLTGLDREVSTPNKLFSSDKNEISSIRSKTAYIDCTSPSSLCSLCQMSDIVETKFDLSRSSTWV